MSENTTESRSKITHATPEDISQATTPEVHPDTPPVAEPTQQISPDNAEPLTQPTAVTQDAASTVEQSTTTDSVSLDSSTPEIATPASAEASPPSAEPPADAQPETTAATASTDSTELQQDAEATAIADEPDSTPEAAMPDADAVAPAPEPAAPEEPAVYFADLGLHPALLSAIDKLGFSQCTPIQAKSLPLALHGADVIGKAQTGTGKTAAFLVALINTLLTVPEQEERYNGEPRAVILAPTRELALQIEKDAVGLVKDTGLSVLSVVGGMDYKKQKVRLNNEIIDILIGTPGRMIDFITNRDLFLSEVEFVVIDEADRMLDMGFIPDVKRILRNTPKKEYRQTFLFSATFSDNIMNLAHSWTNNARQIEIATDSANAARIEKQCYFTTSEQKLSLLYNIITQQHFDKVIVFANRRDETRKLVEALQRLKIRTALLSGDVPQAKRIKTLENFREGRIQVLVATDVAGRGIHIDGVTHVINYTLPDDPEDYVHRIGRTGRAGRSGISICFACEEDSFEIPKIEELIGEKLDFQHPDSSLLTPIPGRQPDARPPRREHRRRS